MKLNTLKPAEGSVKKKKRIGRGQGSGRGGTSTRGHNGAKSRSGYSRKKGFEGGQMPLQRRVPKFGFKSPNRIEYKVINLDTINLLLEKNSVELVDLDFMIDNRLATKNDVVKILANGTLNHKLKEIKAHAFSKSAVKEIERVGGKISLI